jgi:hypothetical protein
MHRHCPVVVGVALVAGVLCVPDAAAQLPARPSAHDAAPEFILVRGTADGRVHGLVSDAAGAAVVDASVFAVGATVIAARSDVQGRFALSLPPGDYVLRASRSGYVSNYREAVRVRASASLERNITLTREARAPGSAVEDNHAHTDIAWILRHLTRSVLRDGAGSAGPDRGDPGSASADQSATRIVSALADTDFRGQLNFVTTALAGPGPAWGLDGWPRGVAFVSLGAPVPGHGLWQVHAAVASGDRSSWNVLGEYESAASQPHVWSLRLSYSAQGSSEETERLRAAVAVARSVAGMAGVDRWQVTPRLALEYGLRAERFDYLADPQLFSGKAGISVTLPLRTTVSATGSRNMVAPGADEFLPPAAGGPWLPAERMFSPLSARGALRAEEVRHAEVMVEHSFGRSDAWPSVRLRRFHQRSDNQLSTLFDLSGQLSRGQYFVAPVGAVSLDGWGLGVSGQLSPYLHGEVEYVRAVADWDSARRTRDIRRLAPSVLRGGRESLEGLTATLEAELNETATHVRVVYRASSAYSTSDGTPVPLPDGRFDVQVRQALPYQPVRGSRLELVFAVRNLFRDLRGEASWYDELLTVGPPLRLMGGIQVRF